MDPMEPDTVSYTVEVTDDFSLVPSAQQTHSDEAEVGLLVDSIYRNEDAIYESEMDLGFEDPGEGPSHANLFGHLAAVEPTLETGDELSDLEPPTPKKHSPQMDANYREELEARRINDLTSRYLTGQLTFSEFVRGTDGDTPDHDGRDSDEDYQPYSSKKKTKSSSEAFCQDFDTTRSGKAAARGKKGGSKGGKYPRVRHTLPPVLSNLLGQANLKYAQDEKEDAAQICEEVIRQVPQAPGPYKLLALIHRDKGNSALAHHYSLISAHLSPQKSEEWIALAETSLELGEKDQALTCLNQAIVSDRYNPDPRLRQIKLLQSMGESKAAQRARERMVEVLSNSADMTQRHGRLILLQAKIAAREFHQENNLPRATKIMECAIRACKTSALQDDIHLLVELHCEQNENIKGLQILQRECDVRLEPPHPPFIDCDCPDTIAPDLRAKLVVFLVRLDISTEILLKLIDPFLQGNPDDEGDLFLDIVEALMAKNRYDEAMLLLEPLVGSEEFSRAAVWLTHGECLRHLGHVEAAVQSYQQVMQLAPQHVQARLTLSSMLCQLARTEEALDVLRSKEQEPRLLFEEFHLLTQEEDRHGLAVDVAVALISLHVKMDRLREAYEWFPVRRRLDIDQPIENGPSSAELFEVVIKASNICLKLKLMSKWKRLAFLSLHVKPLNQFKKEVDFNCLVAAVHARDSNITWPLTRELMFKNIEHNNAWNMYGLAVRFPEDSKHTRFVVRLLSKFPLNWAAGICHANNLFLAGAYKDALVEYASRHQVSADPYTALMLGITWTHLACQRRISERGAAVLQARGFLEEYSRLRGPACRQEVCYNLGRAMHQLSIMDLAMHYYHQALQITPEDHKLDLRREIAFNLSLIYRHSGNARMARKVLCDHFVV